MGVDLYIPNIDDDGDSEDEVVDATGDVDIYHDTLSAYHMEELFGDEHDD